MLIKGARSVRFIYGIPACAGMTKRGAGMARWGRGNGGMGFIRWMPAEFLREWRRKDAYWDMF